MKQSKRNPFCNWKLLSISVLILAFAVAGCDQTPLTPNNPPGNNDHPTISGKALGVMAVTISGIGSHQMKASARAVPLASGFNIAADKTSEPTPPANQNGSGDGSIQMKPISEGSFTKGVRGDGGTRYLFATFKVRNADSTGTPYDTPRKNLTFIAMDSDTTLGYTSITQLQLYDGTELGKTNHTRAVKLAKQITPTGKVAYIGGKLKPVKADVLQVLTQDEADNLSNKTGVDVFQYGFVTHSPHSTPHSRKLKPNPASGEFAGLVTFAFKMPLAMRANKDPFRITMLFLVVDDPQVRLTQSLQEQTPAGAKAIAGRVEQLKNVSYVSLLPGNNFKAIAPTRRVCGPVRIAGQEGTATAISLFPTPPGLQSLSPNPKAGSASSIPATTTFSATFDKAVQKANAGNFIVRGSQSGLHFMGGSYTTNGSTVTSPSGTFFPGERVRVTLTTGLGSCKPTVAAYRVGVTLGSGSFDASSQSPISVGGNPWGITAGDLDSDGHPDLAVTNYHYGTVSILINRGSGGFTVSQTITVGSNSKSITAGDWDGDGDLDLAVTNLASATVSILANNGAGHFSVTETISVGNHPYGITAGDWNRDGDLDLAVTVDGGTVSILGNNGSGHFSVAQTLSLSGEPQGITAGDWNSDGDLDLAVVGTGTAVSILKNNGSGSFSVVKTGRVGNGIARIAAGDWNGDGDLDLVTTTYGPIPGKIFLLKNNGTGHFSAGQTISGLHNLQGIIAGNWDGSNGLDLAVIGGAQENGSGAVSILTNNGSGSFSVTKTIFVGNRPRGISAGDWDDNGSLDLAVTSRYSGVDILINQ